MRHKIRLVSARLRHPLLIARRAIGDARPRQDVLRLRADVLYPNLAALVERHRASGVGLTRHELKVFSQNGEDGVIAEVLRRAGTTTRTFVEFGVESGVEGNCVFLADALGWQGIFIEGDEALHARLAAKYAANDDVQTLRHLVTAENINGILSSGCRQRTVDILSIDIDGNDYWVWKAIDAVDARVVIIEYNGTIDPRKALVQPYQPFVGWDSTNFYGASVAALVELGREKGYTLVHTELTGSNAFFVKDELAPQFADLGPPPLRSANNWLAGRTHIPGPASAEYLQVERSASHDQISGMPLPSSGARL